MPPAPAADMQAEFARQRRQSALERADHAGGDAGRVPVHPHHGAERLEPERVGEAAQQLVAAVMVDDRLTDDGTEARHAVGQPSGNPPAMQRQVGASRSSSQGFVRAWVMSGTDYRTSAAMAMR